MDNSYIYDHITVSTQEGNAKIKCVRICGIDWYNAKQLTSVLGYKNTNQAIRTNVYDDDQKTLSDIISVKLKDYNEGASIYINHRGLKSLITKSNKPASIEIARQFGIDVETKYLRKEIEIVSFVQQFLTSLHIPFEFQKAVGSYKIDLYLPDQRLAVEIDEFGHIRRCPIYEQQREQYITKALNCVFLRINPDDNKFNIATCLADITRYIIKQ